MAYGNLTFTTNANAIESRARREALSADVEFLDLGSDSFATLTAERVNLLNEVEREVWRENPALGLGSTTISVDADENTVALPAAVWQADIMGVFLDDANSGFNGYEVEIVGRGAVQGRDFAADLEIAEYPPRFCYFDESSTTTGNIVFSGLLAQDTDFTLHYRVKPRTFTSNDLASNSVVYSALPNEWMHVSAILLASKFCGLLPNLAREQQLQDKYMVELRKMQDAFIRMPDRWSVRGKVKNSLSGDWTQGIGTYTQPRTHHNIRVVA